MRSKSSLFLIELIIVILFFSLASAVCIQLFVKAHLFGQETERGNRFLTYAQNYAEVYRGVDGDEEAFLHFLDIASTDSRSITLYYNADYERCSDTDARYSCVCTLTEEDSIHTLLMRFYVGEDTTPFYELTVQKYAKEVPHA